MMLLEKCSANKEKVLGINLKTRPEINIDTVTLSGGVEDISRRTCPSKPTPVAAPLEKN